MKIWFLGWLVSWASLLESIVEVVSLNLWIPSWSCQVAVIYDRARWDPLTIRELGEKT